MFKSVYNWYRRHQVIQWLIILIPLWLQPLHMWGMGEMVVHHHGIVNLDNVEYHIAHVSFWTDIFILSIDHLEWVSIAAGTEKFIRWLITRKKVKSDRY